MIAFALAWPTCGPQGYSDQFAREGVAIAPVTVWRLLRRRHLGTRRARLAVLERGSATTGLLTERTAKTSVTSKRASRATCCRWIRSMSANSKASARCGKSPGVMSRRRSAGRGCVR